MQCATWAEVAHLLVQHDRILRRSLCVARRRASCRLARGFGPRRWMSVCAYADESGGPFDRRVPSHLSDRREVSAMPEQRPTNERLGELLDELLSEVRELRKGQERLADDVQKLAERSER
jgi:hypothetical protein